MKEIKINEDKKFNQTTVKYEVVCETKEEFELFLDFIASMKKLKEQIIKK